MILCVYLATNINLYNFVFVFLPNILRSHSILFFFYILSMFKLFFSVNNFIFMKLCHHVVCTCMVNVNNGFLLSLSSIYVSINLSSLIVSIYYLSIFLPPFTYLFYLPVTLYIYYIVIIFQLYPIKYSLYNYISHHLVIALCTFTI